MPAHRKYIELEDRTCPECGKIYKVHPVRLRHGRQTTCSRQCSYARRARVHFDSAAHTELICAICHAPVKRYLYKTKRVKWVSTCSRICKGKAQTAGLIEHNPKPYVRGPRHALWSGGQISNYGRGWKAVKRAARLRDNYTCRRCGITERPGQPRLQVHHVIPFREFKDSRIANRLDNLICYCGKCHATVEAELRRTKRKSVPSVSTSDPIV